MTHSDPFTLAHKGLRAALYRAGQQAARTDFADRAAAEAAVRSVRAALAFLDEHARAEEAIIAPELRRISLELALQLHEEDARLAAQAVELDRRGERLLASAVAGRASHGVLLARELNGLIAAQLRHMEREESVASRLLQAHCREPDLAQMRERLQAALPSARRLEWFALLLPAVDPSEQALLAGHFAAAAPAKEAAPC